MPNIVLNFNYPINQSCQKGDIAYYVSTVIEGGFSVNQQNENIIEIGPITNIENIDSNGDGNIDTTQVTCDKPETTPNPSTDPADYIFFAKDRSVNESSLTGYYSQFNFVNNSREKAELFSVGCQVSESSK